MSMLMFWKGLATKSTKSFGDLDVECWLLDIEGELGA